MSISPQPPPDLVGQIQWLIAQVINLQRRLNGVSSSGGGGGSVTLTENQIAYGSASNEVTSSNKLTYDPDGAGLFIVNTTNASILINGSLALAGIGDVFGEQNGTVIATQDNERLISAVSGFDVMLSLNAIDAIYTIGDFSSLNNGTKLVIDDTATSVKIGEVSKVINGTVLTIKDDNKSITAGCNAYPDMLSLNGDAGTMSIGDVGGNVNGTNLLIEDSINTISHASASGSVAINLSNLTTKRARTEPDKAGEYAVGWFAGVSDPLSGGTVTVTDANATTASIINITPIDNGTPIVSSNFSVVRASGSFDIVDTAAGANDGLTFMYMFTNP